MASWNHRLEPLRRDSRREREYSCSSCRGPYQDRPRAAVYVCYDYTTGRAGRTSSARKGVCQAHADRFAAKHGLPPTTIDSHQAETDAFSTQVDAHNSEIDQEET